MRVPIISRHALLLAALLLVEVHAILPVKKWLRPRCLNALTTTAPAPTQTSTARNNILPFPPPQQKIDAATLTALVAADPGDDLDEPLRLISGEIPKDLRGTLYVNGPARVIDGRGRAAHPLDGHGFVRAFSFFGDGVKVRGRFVRTWAYEIENFFDRNMFRGFFSLPFAPSTPLRLFNALSLWRKNACSRV